jgi:hypothetical protein
LGTMGLRHTEHRAANFLQNKSPIDTLLKKKRKLSSNTVKGDSEGIGCKVIYD